MTYMGAVKHGNDFGGSDDIRDTKTPRDPKYLSTVQGYVGFEEILRVLGSGFMKFLQKKYPHVYPFETCNFALRVVEADWEEYRSTHSRYGSGRCSVCASLSTPTLKVKCNKHR